MALIALAVSIWTIFSSQKTREIVSKIPKTASGYSGLEEIKRKVDGLVNSREGIPEVVKSRVDELFARTIGAPDFLRGIGLADNPEFIETVIERVNDIIRDPSEDVQDSFEQTVKDGLESLSNSEEFNLRVKEKIIEYLNGELEGIIETVLDSDHSAYDEIVGAINDWVPGWMSAELQDPGSELRGSIIELISEKVRENF